MRKNLKSCLPLVMSIILVSLLADPFLMRTTPFIGDASAHTREFETNITIPVNGTRALDIMFIEGNELDLIFSLQVKQELPIDVWFVDYANYVRFVDGNEFLYYIDGSGQELKQAKKIVSVTQHGTYELVFANYNDQPVEVYLTYDINVYPIASEPPPITGKVVGELGDPIEGAIVQLRNGTGSIVATYTTNSIGAFEFFDTPFGTYNLTIFADGFEDNNEASATISSDAPTVDVGSIELTAFSEPPPEGAEEETPLWQSAIFLAPIMLVIGILIGLIVSSLVSSKKAEDEDELDEELDEAEEDELDEDEEDEEAEEEDEEEPSEKPGESKEEHEVTEKAFSPSFCGHCGKPVETPFCPFCGKMVQAPTTPLGEGSSET